MANTTRFPVGKGLVSLIKKWLSGINRKNREYAGIDWMKNHEYESCKDDRGPNSVTMAFGVSKIGLASQIGDGTCFENRRG